MTGMFPSQWHVLKTDTFSNCGSSSGFFIYIIIISVALHFGVSLIISASGNCPSDSNSNLPLLSLPLHLLSSPGKRKGRLRPSSDRVGLGLHKPEVAPSGPSVTHRHVPLLCSHTQAVMFVLAGAYRKCCYRSVWLLISPPETQRVHPVWRRCRGCSATTARG